MHVVYVIQKINLQPQTKVSIQIYLIWRKEKKAYPSGVASAAVLATGKEQPPNSAQVESWSWPLWSRRSMKKASPASPSTMCRSSTFCPFTSMSTIFSLLRITPSLPKRTWNGEHLKLPSSCFTTTTSIAPALTQTKQSHTPFTSSSRLASSVSHFFLSFLTLFSLSVLCRACSEMKSAQWDLSIF